MSSEVAGVIFKDACEPETMALRGLQSTLGASQDATITIQWLRAAGSDPAMAFVAGRLVELELAENDQFDGRWRRAWEHLMEDRSTRRWL